MTRSPFTAVDWLTWSAEMTAQAAVLVTALRLPRRDRPHVLLFGFVLVAEVWMRVVQEVWFIGAPSPLPAPLRVLYHVETGLVTAWPAAVAALAWWAWRGPQKPMAPGESSEPLGMGFWEGFWPGYTPVHAGAARAPNLRTLPLAVKAISFLWLAFNAALIAAHPLPRGWTQPALHAFAAACVLAGVVAIVAGWARHEARAAQVAGYLVVVEGVVVLVGPWAGDVFRQWRTVGAGMYAVAFTLLAGWQWWRRQQVE